MENKEENNTEVNQSFKLSAIGKSSPRCPLPSTLN